MGLGQLSSFHYCSGIFKSASALYLMDILCRHSSTASTLETLSIRSSIVLLLRVLIDPTVRCGRKRLFSLPHSPACFSPFTIILSSSLVQSKLSLCVDMLTRRSSNNIFRQRICTSLISTLNVADRTSQSITPSSITILFSLISSSLSHTCFHRQDYSRSMS